MIRVLIVDDEPLVAENIKASMDWEYHGFQVVGIAGSGKAALELMEDKFPDIVLTDMKMPGMSGVELIRQAACSYPEMKFVIISGYADFAYAQEAMEYGAAAYCLKPLDEQELLRVMLKLKARIMTEKNFDADFLETAFNKESTQAIGAYLNETGHPWAMPVRFLVFYYFGNGWIRLPASMHALRVHAGMYEQVLLVEDGQRHTVMEQVRRFCEDKGEDLPTGASVGFGGVAETMSEAGECIRRARVAAYHFFVRGRHGFFNTEDCCGDDETDARLKRLEHDMERRDIPSIERFFAEEVERFREGKANLQDAFRLYNGILYFMDREAVREPHTYAYGYDALPRLFSDAEDMCASLCREAVARCAATGIKVDEYQLKNDTVRSIVRFINENYWKDISIQEIADRFFINMSYLCQVFKKETGKTLMEYITSLRIGYACRLLQQGEFSVGEVCEKVGYIDYYHFNKVFKRVTGLTPLQYLNQHKADEALEPGGS